VLLIGSVAHADDVQLCIEASEQGQVARDQGKLLDARERFTTCAREACPNMIRADCAAWLETVRQGIPSLVPSARDEAGVDLVDVAIEVDGAPMLDKLDGRAIELDPGEHMLVWRHGNQRIEQRVLVRQGEKNRPVDAVFEPDQPPTPAPAAVPTVPAPTDPEGSLLPTASWVLGAVAVVGLAGFVGLGINASGERDELLDTCAPNCDDGAVDAIRTQVIVANVSLGVGIAALGAAVWIAVADEPTTQVSVAVDPTGVTLRGMF